jgi:hypothetical protein
LFKEYLGDKDLTQDKNEMLKIAISFDKSLVCLAIVQLGHGQTLASRTKLAEFSTLEDAVCVTSTYSSVSTNLA